MAKHPLVWPKHALPRHTTPLENSSDNVDPDGSDVDPGVLHILPLGFSSVSLFATILSTYWLVRMRRSFRHDLIILLIISDLTKSLWMLLYDIISIASHRQLKSSSVFCQINAFFFAMGLEAADAAVFLIALHSTVYIFWPNRAGGNSGLYPYRRGAYAFFALWPVLMASLGFVTGTSAYVNTGQFCYLPTKPWWYRTALSWIPRYVNLMLILLMYSSSYMYIRLMINRYSRRNSEVPMGRTDRLVPPTPPLVAHDLIISSPAESVRLTTGATVPTPKAQKKSRPKGYLNIRESFRGQLSMLQSGMRTRGQWAWAGFESAPRGSHTPEPSSAGVSPSGGTAIPGAGATKSAEETVEVSQALVPGEMPKVSVLEPVMPTGTPSSTRYSIARGPPSPAFDNRPSTYQTGLEDYFSGSASVNLSRARTGSLVHIKRILLEGPHRISTSESAKSSLIALDQTTFESGGISRNREHLRRQIRCLFVYPVVYACIWIFPFAEDLSIFYQSVHNHPSNWLALCSLISLSVQGLADSLVFFVREKPWRHLRSGFWRSMGLDFSNSWNFSLRKNSGRTREEMFNDSTRAQFRREEELELESVFRGSPSGRRPPTAGGQNWWDAECEGSGHQRRSTLGSSEEAGPSSEKREIATDSLAKAVKRVSLSLDV